MASFRFLNPRLVDEYPYSMDDVCYRGIGDNDRDVLCRDLPPNRLRFLGWWYITPERHFWEFVGFLVVGVIVITLLGPKILPSKYLRLPFAMNNALTPRLWMKASSLLFFPYVAYTKLSWKGSNYPGRWLMFVGMPVGTLWILSVLFCFSSSAIAFLGRRRGESGNTWRRSDEFRYMIRFWLLETWFSFLPLLVNLMPDLFKGAVSSAWQYANGKAPRSGQDGDNAAIAYFCHGLYLVMAPAYYSWTGELSLHQNPTTHQSICFRRIITLAIHCIHRQVIGTAICATYYMCIITPASIVAGLNVNFMLEGASDEGPNFRIYVVAKWLYQGCLIRIVLEAAKSAWGMSLGQFSLDDHDERQYQKKRQQCV